ncbi:MAG: ATP-dependent helicase [Anaerolineae bacterium]|nr:ATP-dependent helicase [Anaerolineae bacterium]
MAWEIGLTEAQKSAASHYGSSARILAGPGTGKTRTLTNHVAYLLEERNVPANEIVVLTFTRAAANELRSRLIEELGLPESDLPNVRTLHSFALRTLLDNASHAGITQPLRVADDFEEQHVLYLELNQVLDRSAKEIKDALRAYEATWNTLNKKDDEWESIEFGQALEEELHSLCEVYNFILRGQLIHKLVEFLEANPLIVQSLNIGHVLVDEYQDLNLCDQQAIALLEEAGASLFVVGDDDQCIYQFRHAHPQGIRTFTRNRNPVGDYQLDVCHRCPQPIVQMGNKLIGREAGRLPKAYKSWGNAPSGVVSVLQFSNQEDEAANIANICRHYITRKGLSPRDIAILLATRRLSRPIEDALRQQNIPIASLTLQWPLGGAEDKEDHKGRQVYCVLRLLVDHGDSLALRTWLGAQDKVGIKAINQLRQYCRDRRLKIWDACSLISNEPNQLPRHGQTIKRHFERLRSWLLTLQGHALTETVIYECLNFVDINSPERDHIVQFLGNLTGNNNVTVSQLLLTLQTLDLQAESFLDNNAVRIMTIHKAKGLSSELVIIPALEEEMLPGRYEEDDARRLLYVAMTRSCNYLIMTHALYRSGSQSYLGQGTGQPKRQRSRFLNEIGVSSVRGTQYVTHLETKPTMSPPPPAATRPIKTAILRELLNEALSDDEITELAFDHFRRVYDQFGAGMGKGIKISKLIEYCERQSCLDTLVSEIELRNRNRFRSYQDRLYS